MNARPFCVLWATCAVICGMWSARPAWADEATAVAVASAYEEGDAAAFFPLLTNVIAAAKRDQALLAVVDESLETDDKPSLGMMSLEMRARTMAAGGDFLNPRPSPGESLLLLPALVAKAESVIKHVQSLPVMQAKVEPPKRIAEYDPLFAQLTEAQQQCGAFKQLVEQGARLQASAKRQRGLTEQQKAAVNRDLRELAKQLADLHRQTKFRDVLLRLRRVDTAVAVLRDSQDKKERLIAAHTLDYDSSLLTKLYRSPAWKSLAEGIQASPQLPSETDAKLEQGKELAGKEWDIAKLLFAGIHHWMQGRYGRSSEYFGLVKPEIAVQRGAGSAVYVPEQYDSNSNYQYPQRRHHYTWTWETRRVVRVRNVQVERKNSARPKPAEPKRVAPAPKVTVGVAVRMRLAPTGGGGMARGGSGNVKAVPGFQLPYGHQYGTIDRPYSWTTADVYRRHGYQPPPQYQRPKRSIHQMPMVRILVDDYQHVPPQDPRSAQRLVGFSEYQRALECFDALVHISDEEQLKAVDELIKERDELEVQTNLSAKLPRQPGPLDNPPDTPKKRRGLIWLTALARSELAAMLVGFADQGTAFVDLAKPYDLEAYRELVRDALLTHYWSLKNDGLLASLSASGSDTQVLAYLRRLIVTHTLLGATAALYKDTFDASHQQQMTIWATELKQAARLLTQRFRSFIGP